MRTIRNIQRDLDDLKKSLATVIDDQILEFRTSVHSLVMNDESLNHLTTKQKYYLCDKINEIIDQNFQ